MSSIVLLDEYKRWLGQNNGLADDVDLQADLDASELGLRTHCHRDFTIATTSTARQFDVVDVNELLIDDCTAVASVADSSGTVPASSYQLRPLNNRSLAGVTVPTTKIVRLLGWWTASYAVPVATVTATWGWSAIPADVKQAVKLLAKDQSDMRFIKNGVAGFDAFGVVRVRDNATAAALLRDYVREDRAAIA